MRGNRCLAPSKRADLSFDGRVCHVSSFDGDDDDKRSIDVPSVTQECVCVTSDRGIARLRVESRERESEQPSRFSRKLTRNRLPIICEQIECCSYIFSLSLSSFSTLFTHTYYYVCLYVCAVFFHYIDHLNIKPRLQYVKTRERES